MNSCEINSHVSTIEEYIFEMKRIVTCCWLSKTLGLHTNISKQLLHTFIEKCPKRNELIVTYLIIGSVSVNEPCKILIVKETDLQAVENSLSNITSKHIYSIQKSLNLTDVNLLYTAQTDEIYDTFSKGISAINFSCNERDDKLIAKLKLDSLPSVSKAPIGITKKIHSNNENTTDNKNPDQSKKTSSIEDKKSPDPLIEPKSDIVPSVVKNRAAPKKKNDKFASSNKKQQGGIGAFFSKSVDKPINRLASNVPKNNSEQKSENEKPKFKVSQELSPSKENTAPMNIQDTNKTETNILDTSKTSHEKPKKPESKNVKSMPKKIESKQSKKRSAKQNVKDTKKRKRLVVLSDSESSNCSEDEEVVREPTPEPESTPVPEAVENDIVLGTPEPTKKRKRKLISKTFTSAEGYMVTEKHYVDASCSEDDEGAPGKKFKETKLKDENKITEKEKEEKVSPKPTISPQKKVQASLMSFFKKK